mmetsp:Transcript_6114/g.12684  ORF Transcript_6114/g.12684 Transcript_6114/m.12684 type:complete len:356 (+) Transcript_6114:36-1103(+)
MASPAPAGGFGKIAVMLPVMLYARKLDADDPNIVFMLRCSYAVVQAGILTILFLTHNKLHSKYDGDTTPVYTPKAPTFMDAADKPPTYTKSTRSAAYRAKFQELVSSTFMGMLMTLGLHWYKGMVVGLAMQCVMGPFNIYENMTVRMCILTPNSVKDLGEVEALPDDAQVVEVVAGQEKVVQEPRSAIAAKAGVTKSKKAAAEDDAVPLRPKAGGRKLTKAEFEDLMLDTWDQANAADLAPLIAALDASNVSHATAESGWTPLMVFCGLSNAAAFEEGIARCLDLGCDVDQADADGWSALHWCAYHGNARAAQLLKGRGDIRAKDKEGKDVERVAKDEGNVGVWIALGGEDDKVD